MPEKQNLSGEFEIFMPKSHGSTPLYTSMREPYWMPLRPRDVIMQGWPVWLVWDVPRWPSLEKKYEKY